MKKSLAIFVLVFLAVTLWAQSSQKISYQAVIRNSRNALVINSQVGIRISILQGSASGTVVYTEVQTPTTNGNGLLSVEIGSDIDFSTIAWENNIHFIKTEIDPTGGTNYTISGTSQLMSVPYALHAKTAEQITGTITETDPIYLNSQAATITASDITKLSNLSGTNTGDQDLTALATTASVTTGLSTKVDKVEGKGLSAEDYTTVEKTKLAAIAGTNTGDQDLTALATIASVTTGLSGKVDKEAGKGLSAEDYTTVEKTKLAAITGTNTGDQDLTALATTASVTTGLSGKVDKVEGKGLSAEDYTTVEKTKLAAITGTNTGDQDLTALATTASVTTGLSGKVDKEAGKGLSAEDYTTVEKTKLAAITGTNTGDQDLTALATTASVTTGLSGKVDKQEGKGLSAEDYTTVEKTKLAGIVAGAEVNVNADWNAVTGDAQILNKPTIPASLYIGQSYQGGIIFWLDDSGLHGLIAATEDQSTGVVWTTAALQTTLSNAARNGVYSGQANTERVIIHAGAGSYAAQICANYQGGGYGDWYLPSYTELDLMYKKRGIIGGFADAQYWSSTEYDNSRTWRQYFLSGSGYQYADFKGTEYCVRAIRKF